MHLLCCRTNRKNPSTRPAPLKHVSLLRRLFRIGPRRRRSNDRLQKKLKNSNTSNNHCRSIGRGTGTGNMRTREHNCIIVAICCKLSGPGRPPPPPPRKLMCTSGKGRASPTDLARHRRGAREFHLRPRLALNCRGPERDLHRRDLVRIRLTVKSSSPRAQPIHHYRHETSAGWGRIHVPPRSAATVEPSPHLRF